MPTAAQEISFDIGPNNTNQNDPYGSEKKRNGGS
jgi:hypothetical protein